MTKAFIDGSITGPPADKLYAVDPVGVAKITPSPLLVFSF